MAVAAQTKCAQRADNASSQEVQIPGRLTRMRSSNEHTPIQTSEVHQVRIDRLEKDLGDLVANVRELSDILKTQQARHDALERERQRERTKDREDEQIAIAKASLGMKEWSLLIGGITLLFTLVGTFLIPFLQSFVPTPM